MERAGLEAALEASGLLDAWVLPGGRLLNTSDGEDVFLNSSEELGHCENNLTAVLTAAIDPHSLAAQQISAAHIEKILAHIGWGRQSSSCWVEVETTENRGQGSFRLGPQVGQWAKSQAQHLGHGARAENRRRRCVELDNLMAELQTNIVESQAQAQQLQKYQTILKQEREALPSTQPIQKGHARCAQVQLQLEAQRRKMETLNQQVDEVQHQYLAIQDEMKASVEDFKLLNCSSKAITLGNKMLFSICKCT